MEAQPKQVSKGLDPSTRIVVSEKIEAAGQTNSYRKTVEWKNPDGKIEETVTTATWDGKDQANDRKGDIPGEYTSSTQRVDNSRAVEIFKRNGKEYQRSEASISSDGRIQTHHQSGIGRTTGKPFDL